MNKTISVNIGGRVFNIEELAYDKLSRYLNTIRGYFEKRESTDEIISDIELRIAELFMERISNQKQVITEKDVDEIIVIMGKPEDYMDGDEEEIEYEQTQSKGRRSSSKVFRDPDNKIILGVCSGISAYFGIDPIIMRAIFAVSFIFYGSGLILYFILALIIPKAKTTAEKLQMHGEPVTVDNISRKVSESFHGVKDDLKDFGKKNNINESRIRNAGNQTGDFLSDLFNNLARILRILLVILVKVIGVCLIIAGIGGIMVALGFLFGWDTFLVFAHNGFVNDMNLPIFVQSLFDTPFDKTMLTVGMMIVLIAPAIGFLLLGIRLLFDYKRIPVWIGIALVIIWFVGATMLAASGTDIYKQFQTETSFTENVPLVFSNSGMLYLDIIEDHGAKYKFTNGFGNRNYLNTTDVTFPGVNSTDIIYIGDNEFTVETNLVDSLYHLRIERGARGSSQKDAIVNARSIVSNEIISGDSLLISRYFAVLKDGNIRGQEVKYILSIPVGKSIYFTKGSLKIIYDVPNVTDTYDGKMINRAWKMTPDGLMNPHFSRKQKHDDDTDYNDSYDDSSY